MIEDTMVFPDGIVVAGAKPAGYSAARTARRNAPEGLSERAIRRRENRAREAAIAAAEARFTRLVRENPTATVTNAAGAPVSARRRRRIARGG